MIEITPNKLSLHKGVDWRWGPLYNPPMSSQTLLFILFILITYPLFAVELIVNVPAQTPGNDLIYFTGNIPGRCHWEPKCIPLQKIGNHSYRVDITILKPGTEFKITRGSWDSEATTSQGVVLPNFVVPTNTSRLVINIANWKDKNIWGVKGHLRVFPNFYSPQLNNTRALYIWVPSEYYSSTRSFPVIYMHDGQNLFDPKSSAFGNEWGVDEALESFFKNKGHSAIVIGIENTSNRNDEYTYLKSGKQYADFIIETVKPFVDWNFRTLPAREFTYLMGSSMGALISFSILWNHSDVFSKAAGLSFPAFAHDNAIFTFLKKFPKAPTNVHFYLDHGSQGRDSGYSESARNFVNEVTNRYHFPHQNLNYALFPFADHTEIDWARRVSHPLQFLLRK